MFVERRRKPRLCDPISVRVHGIAGGESFCFDTVARNISAHGICAPAPRAIQGGEQLSFRIRFALAGTRPLRAPTVTARGVVIRTEEQPDGTSIFAATFTIRSII